MVLGELSKIQELFSRPDAVVAGVFQKE